MSLIKQFNHPNLINTDLLCVSPNHASNKGSTRKFGEIVRLKRSDLPMRVLKSSGKVRNAQPVCFTLTRKQHSRTNLLVGMSIAAPITHS